MSILRGNIHHIYAYNMHIVQVFPDYQNGCGYGTPEQAYDGVGHCHQVVTFSLNGEGSGAMTDLDRSQICVEIPEASALYVHF